MEHDIRELTRALMAKDAGLMDTPRGIGKSREELTNELRLTVIAYERMKLAFVHSGSDASDAQHAIRR